MPSKIVIGNKIVVASRDYVAPRRVLAPTTRNGEIIEDAGRILPTSADSPFRAGSPYYDADDDLTYRSVHARVCDVLQGWRTAEFWLVRWAIEWRTLRDLVQRGWVDAAIEVDTATKRFRCRDERRVLLWIKAKKTSALALKPPTPPLLTSSHRKARTPRRS